MEDKLFNLITGDITDISIERDSYYNCVIKDNIGKTYFGFILAKSPKGHAITICEVSFEKSTKDKKYHPRIIFKRTDSSYKEKKILKGSITQRITFKSGTDGYREFWKLIAFLKRFKDLIDTGDFADKYKVISQLDVLKYLQQKTKTTDENMRLYKNILDKTGIDFASSMHSLAKIRLLHSYREKLQEFINEGAAETDVQNWIDEENHRYRQDRCMIFGLEFINHKREGAISGNRYDILTRIGIESEERVLIELKSPSDRIFNLKKSATINDAKMEYSISSALARALPQILEYRKDLEEKRAGDSELEKIGEQKEVKISKCVIVIGTNVDDPRWKKNLREFRRSLSANLEIWTYTDLLYKIDSVITNLSGNKVDSGTNRYSKWKKV